MQSSRVGLAIVYPDSLEVLWANEAFVALTTEPDIAGLTGRTLPEIFPLGERAGLGDAVHAVQGSGEPITVTVSVVTTGKGSMGLACTTYLIPGGNVLLSAEQEWTPSGRGARFR